MFKSMFSWFALAVTLVVHTAGCQSARRVFPESHRASALSASSPVSSSAVTLADSRSTFPQIPEGTILANANTATLSANDPLYGYYSKDDAGALPNANSGGYAASDRASEPTRSEPMRRTSTSSSGSSGCSSGCCSR